MTTVFPEAPNLPPTIISSTASSASSRLRQMSTPFPRARPSALTTMGQRWFRVRYSLAAETSVKVSYSAVGIWYFFIRSLENALLASIRAAAAVGPKAGIPLSVSRSTNPMARGSSGATTT